MHRRSLLGHSALAAVVIAIAGAVPTTVARAQDAVPKELMRLEDTWGAVQMKRDGATIGRMLMDDFEFTAPDGSRFSKAQLVADIAGSKTEYVSGANTEYKVRVHGNTAVITGLWTATVKTVKGTEVRKYRWTDIWMKQADGKWLCLAGQSALVK